MDLISAVKAAQEAGTSLAAIAKKMNRDPSTLNKWLHGKSQISETVEVELIHALREIKQSWEEIKL